MQQNVDQSEVWYCQFEVSPVNYSDSDSVSRATEKVKNLLLVCATRIRIPRCQTRVESKHDHV